MIQPRAASTVAPLAVLGFLTLLVSTYFVVLQILAREPGAAVATVWTLAFQLLLCLWVRADALERGSIPSRSFGFALYVFLPFLLAWHLVSTRGLRGLGIYGAFAVLYLTPFICSFVSYLVMAALPQSELRLATLC